MVFTVFFSFCNSGKQAGLNTIEKLDNAHEKEREMKSEEQILRSDTTNQEKISQLIQQLNYWVEQGGDPDHRSETEKSTGESNAAFEEIRKKLDSLKVKYYWKDGTYVLEK